MIINIKTTVAMKKLGLLISNIIEPGCIFYLSGEIGVGKTTFVRGVLQGFGYRNYVKSPSFNIIEVYSISKLQFVCHFDLYRLNKPEELIYIGSNDYFDKKNICFIEWPERGIGYLPQSDIECFFNFVDNKKQRIINFSSISIKGERFLSKLHLKTKLMK